jgi:protein involved in polysaccharide export with SLBB domain
VPAGADTVTAQQVADVDASMRDLLVQRDKVKVELEQQLEVMAPEHPQILRLKRMAAALEQRVEDKRREFAARPDARRLLAAGGDAVYYVGGSVPRPGAFQLSSRRVNLLQALIAAGFDVNQGGPLEVRLLRRVRNDDRESVRSMTVKELLNDRGRDTFLEADDVVIVRRPAAPNAGS